VKLCQALLRERGHVVSYDWTEDDKKCGVAGVDENFIPRDRTIARALAKTDFDGVLSSDAMIFLPCAEGGRGCYVEFGMALAMEIPVIVVGEHLNAIFMFLPGVRRVETVSIAVEELAQLAEECRLDLAAEYVKPGETGGGL